MTQMCLRKATEVNRVSHPSVPKRGLPPCRRICRPQFFASARAITWRNRSSVELRSSVLALQTRDVRVKLLLWRLHVVTFRDPFRRPSDRAMSHMGYVH